MLWKKNWEKILTSPEKTLGTTESLSEQPTVDMRKEMARRKSQYTQILEMLKDRKTVTNIDLSRISLRYSARIGEIRKDYKVVANYYSPGVFTYTYKGEK